MGDVILESLFDDVYTEDRWRPLSLGAFFSEGWREPWASGPAGRDGLTPRHGWLGAFDGVFFRLWLTSFSYFNSVDTPYHGNRYAGNFQIFLPFSRRFEVAIDAPFVVSNGTAAAGRGYVSRFGDMVITPRFLLSESAAATQIFALDIGAPTGSHATGGGIMAIAPRYAFWYNPGGPWVVRGGSGMSIPLNPPQTPASTSYIGDLAIGRYFSPHDVPFGDLVFYIATNWTVPLGATSESSTYFGLGPGTRFHVTQNYFFLHYWEFPLIGPHAFTYNTQFAIVKVF
jgi:hypothetical protein